LLTPTAILDPLPGESKVQDDLPQLPNRNGQGGVLWPEKGSTLEVPAVRSAVL